MRLATVFAISSILLNVAWGDSVHKREQQGVPPTPPLDLRPLEWADVNFIHTTDTHGWLEGHIKEENYNADYGDFYSFAVSIVISVFFKGSTLILLHLRCL